MKNSFKKIISLSTLILIFINPVLIFANDFLNTYNNTNNNDGYTNVDGGAGVLPPRPTTYTGPTATQNNFSQLGDLSGELGPNPFTQQNPYDPNNPNLSPQFINSQIQNSVLATAATTSTVQANSAVAGSATGIASCLGSQIVSQAIVQSVNSFASNAIGSVTDSIINIPVAESGSTGAAIKTETSARVGTGVSLFGLSIPTLPSWDSMAYCIVNTMIIYIADSTIQWVNTGFEGNPAFLNNPDQFFKDLANQEKIAFLQGLAYGVNSSVCGVYKSTVLSAILSRYGRNQQNYGQPGYQNGGYGYSAQGGPQNSCAFDQNPGQLNLFLRGDFSQGGGWNTWFEITQNPINNPYDTYFNSVDRLDQRVQNVQTSQERELNWNNGYLSFRKCENGEKDKSKCPVTTPGSVVESQLIKTLNLGKDRLVLAEKFDQVVTAVIDQLITTALDKTLSMVNENLSQSFNNSNNPNNSNNSNTNSTSSNNSNQNTGNGTNTTPIKPSNTNSNTNSTSSNSGSTSLTTTNYKFERDLRKGGNSSDVIELRKFLIAQGVLNPSLNTSPSYDADVTVAVLKFQENNNINFGIVEAGNFTDETRRKANQIQGY